MADLKGVAAGATGASVAGGSIPDHDQGAGSQDDLGRGRITRMIHRIWLDEPIPGVFRSFGRKWRRLHPDWLVLDWTSITRLDLPAQRVRDRAKDVIPHDWKRFEADVLRLELLYEFGGLYVDMDVEPHAPIDPLLEGKKVLVGRSPNVSKGYHAITNCVMASVPGHPYIRALIDGLEDAIENHSGEHLARMIGPWHLDRTYSQGDWPDVTVVHPWSKLDPYLTHYWNNALRKKGEGLA